MATWLLTAMRRLRPMSKRAKSGAVSGNAGDSLLLFDEGGVTLLHVGMI